MLVGFNLNCCWFISTVQPESKPEEVSAPKDVASPASPPASVCPVSAAKPPRTNTSSPSAQAAAAPALSAQVRPRAGNGNDTGSLLQVVQLMVLQDELMVHLGAPLCSLCMLLLLCRGFVPGLGWEVAVMCKPGSSPCSQRSLASSATPKFARSPQRSPLRSLCSL